MKVERGQNTATGSDWNSRHPVISEHVREPLGHDSNSNACFIIYIEERRACVNAFFNLNFQCMDLFATFYLYGS